MGIKGVVFRGGGLGGFNVGDLGGSVEVVLRTINCEDSLFGTGGGTFRHVCPRRENSLGTESSLPLSGVLVAGT